MNKINYEDILDYKVEKNFVFIISLAVLLILIYLVCTRDIYSSFEFTGIYKDQEIVASVPYEDVNIVTSNEVLFNNDENYSYVVLSLEDLFLNGEVYYQSITLSAEVNLIENELSDFEILYNKEKVLKKIINLIL